MSDTIRMALVYGSTREGRFCDTIARWAAEQVARHGGFELDRIDPGELALPSRMQNAHDPAVESLKQRIDRADAFIVVTPEYNHSFAAPLKFLIDLVKREWEAKPVAFVSYGGLSGGLRAVEQLRLVFAELHAVTVRDTVSFINASTRFDRHGELRDGEEAEKAMTLMLNRVGWWAQSLRQARDRVPYADAV